MQSVHHIIKTIKIKILELAQKFSLIIRATDKFVIEKKSWNMKIKNSKKHL